MICSAGFDVNNASFGRTVATTFFFSPDFWINLPSSSNKKHRSTYPESRRLFFWRIPEHSMLVIPGFRQVKQDFRWWLWVCSLSVSGNESKSTANVWLLSSLSLSADCWLLRQWWDTHTHTRRQGGVVSYITNHFSSDVSRFLDRQPQRGSRDRRRED